jgi:hypothetical protein
LVLILAGCGGSDQSGSGGGSQQGQSRVRVIHASPDAPNLDAYAGDTKVFTDVAYGTASAYVSVNSGQRRFRFRQTGSSTNMAEVVMDFPKGEDYTCLAMRSAASMSILVLDDENHALPSAGKFKVRIVHASPSAGAADVYVLTPGEDINAATPKVVNLLFNSSSDYLEYTAGAGEIILTQTGTKTVVVDSGAVTFAAGQIRTIVALDAPGGGTPLSTLVVADVN